jgi:hypothetical protein
LGTITDADANELYNESLIIQAVRSSTVSGSTAYSAASLGLN